MDIEKATLKKATVSILPLWADAEAEAKYSTLQPIRSGRSRGSTPSPPPPAHITDKNAAIDDAAIGTSLKPAYANGTPHQRTQSHVSPSRSHGSLANLFHHRQASSSDQASASKSHSSLTNIVIHQQQQITPQQPLAERPLSSSTYSLDHHSTLSSSAPDWSVFATMSNVSTLSTQLSQKVPFTQAESETMDEEAEAHDGFSLRRFPPRLDEIFKSKSTGHQPGCPCSCPGMQGGGAGHSTASSRNFMTSKRQARKASLSATRGYPTGQCVSTDPPDENTWDEKDDVTIYRKQTIGTNQTINMDVLKGFVNSPFFSNVLKSLTVMAAVSVFAIALDSIILLVKTPDQKNRLTNDNACLIITVILTVLTIAYSVFNIFLESRRPPEGLNTTRSKPLTVIISEIVASILWGQILSITIYTYIWTYGCTAAGQEQLSRLWKEDAITDPHLQDRLCRRQGAMVGLEALLVLLLIFNFYTHIEQNFKFIRAVS